MATLPDSRALGERPVPQSSGAVAGYSPSVGAKEIGQIGQIVSGAGRDLEDASQVVAATNDRQDMLVAQSAANSLQQARITQEYDPTTGFRNAKEGQAVGKQFVDTYTQKFTDSSSELREGLANENQKRIFDQHAQVQGLAFKSSLLQHQAQQTDAFNDSTANGAVDLALRTMAQRPTDELTFQMGLAQINGTIEQTGKRKGLPPEAVAKTKGAMLDAAYQTRITSIMDGLPGIAPANPYLAEKMFKQVQDQLGPALQVNLARAVQKSVQSVQARDTASGFIFGNRPPVSPAVIAPAVAGTPPLQNVVMDMESKGRDTDANGNLLTSSAGAQGRMQVMPATSKNPGFGVIPAKDDSPEELARVGTDYLGAMSARYNDPALVMAAYNAGPGQVDKWLAKFGDPRTGAISTADWIAKIPFAETAAYVATGLIKLGNASGTTAPAPAPTANQLKTDLFARVQAARTVAEQQYPGDTAYADSVASRTENYGRTVIANQQGIEAGARDGLFQGIVGTKPDGSDKPMTIDALMADPQQKANWDKATPETKLAIQTHFKNGASDPPRTADSQATLYRYMGMAANDREKFAAEDLSSLIPKLPHADFDRLATLQMGARNKQDLAAEKGANLTHAMTIALDYALKPIGITMPTANSSSSQRETFDQFTGAFRDQLDRFQQANNRQPNDQETADIAKRLTTTIQVKGVLWNSDKRAFQVTPEQAAKVKAEITPEFRTGVTAALTKALGGKAPTEDQVQRAYLLSLRPDLNQRPK